VLITDAQSALVQITTDLFQIQIINKHQH